MKKPFKHTETDPQRRCVDCNMPLKKNLLAKNPEAKRCNVCHHLKSNSTNFPRKRYEKIQRKRRTTYNWYIK